MANWRWVAPFRMAAPRIGGPTVQLQPGRNEMALTDKARGGAKDAADGADEQREEATEAARDTLEDAPDTGDATKTAGDAVQAAVDSVKDMAKDGSQGVMKLVATAARDAAAEVLAREASKGARQAAEYVSQKAPELAKQKLEEHGGTGPAAQAALNFGKAKLEGAGGTKGLLSGAGGAVKGVVDKITGGGSGGKGEGGGAATGYGVKRRMPIQQDVFVSVPCDDAYKGWTEYKRWTEFMFRANQVDSEIEDEEDGEARIKVTEKMWMFKRPFTALVVSQVPNERIRWRSTDGTKHVGTIAFHALGDRLTLISVNIDHAPAGPIEKISRGARFDKRAIRADLHRFKGWVEHKSPDEIEEMEGWLGTVEDGQITKSHDDYTQEQEVEDSGEEGVADGGEEEQDGEGAGEGGGRGEGPGQEGAEDGQEDEQEGEEDDQALEPTDEGDEDEPEADEADEDEADEEPDDEADDDEPEAADDEEEPADEEPADDEGDEEPAAADEPDDEEEPVDEEDDEPEPEPTPRSRR